MAVKMSKRDTMLLGSIGAIAVLGGGYWFVVKPARADVGTARAELEQITSDLDLARSNLDALRNRKVNLEAERTLALRALKAVPSGPQAAGALVSLGRIAERSNVELSSVAASTSTSFGPIEVHQLSVKVTGKFFDVSDFLYRLQHQVEVDANGRPHVRGRLLATTKVEITPLVGGTNAAGTAQLTSRGVSAALDVAMFSTRRGTVGFGARPVAAAAADSTTAGGTGA